MNEIPPYEGKGSKSTDPLDKDKSNITPCKDLSHIRNEEDCIAEGGKWNSILGICDCPQ